MLSRKRGAGNPRPLNLLIPPYSHARPCPSSSWLLPAFFQGPINARLRVAVDSPVLSAAISFLSGGLLLLCIMATGAFRGTGADLRGMQSAPLWAYLGGALGVSFVLGSIVATPQVGVVVVICAAILGQMVGSYLADSFGWFGVERVPYNRCAWPGSGSWCLACCWCKGNSLRSRVRSDLQPSVRDPSFGSNALASAGDTCELQTNGRRKDQGR
jgi:transporter family-2 protein